MYEVSCFIYDFLVLCEIILLFFSLFFSVEREGRVVQFEFFGSSVGEAGGDNSKPRRLLHEDRQQNN